MSILLDREADPAVPTAPVTDSATPFVTPVSPAPSVPEAPAKKPKSLWAYLRVSISAAVLILLVALGAAVILVPWATHSTPMTVLTSSMEPTLPPGTLVVVSPVDVDDIRIGDVITYQLRSGDPAVVTHRVIGFSTNAIGERTFSLQGDNNAEPDADLVRPVQIQGRLWYSVPYIGWVNTWINGEARAWIVPLIAGGLFAYAAWMVISGITDRTKRGAKKNANRASGRHSA